jgi:cytochrome c oxidase subunit 4
MTTTPPIPPTAASGGVATITDPAHDAGLAEEAALIERHEHPSDGTYILIALALAVVTAAEVGIYYLKTSSITTVVLLAMMALKFTVVAGYFMHLKFDSPVLRRLFVGGLVLACFVYSVVFFLFGVFHV